MDEKSSGRKKRGKSQRRRGEKGNRRYCGLHRLHQCLQASSFLSFYTVHLSLRISLSFLKSYASESQRLGMFHIVLTWQTMQDLTNRTNLLLTKIKSKCNHEYSWEHSVRTMLFQGHRSCWYLFIFHYNSHLSQWPGQILLWDEKARWNSLFVQEELKDKGGRVFPSWIHHCWCCWFIQKDSWDEHKWKTKREDEKQCSTGMDDCNFRQDKPQTRTHRI